MQYKVYATELRFQAGKSNKFWRYYAWTPDNNSVGWKGTHWVSSWGRIGATPQCKVQVGRLSDAQAKAREKRAEGYSIYVSEFTFIVPQSDADSWERSLRLERLDGLFYKFSPGARSGPTVKRRPILGGAPPKVRQMSNIESALDKILKAHGGEEE